MGQGMSSPPPAQTGQITDTSNLVKQTDLVGYVKLTDLENYVKVTGLSDYVRLSQLDNYVKLSDANYVKVNDLNNFQKTIENTYVKVSDLQNYVKTSELLNYVKTSDKATADTDPSSQTTYVTPGYFRARLRDTWTAANADPDTTTDKFVTPNFLTNKLSSMVVAPNDPDTITNKFVTPHFLTSRINNLTVSMNDDDTVSNKFVTPQFLSNRLIKSIAQESETAGNNFVTPGLLSNRFTSAQQNWTAPDSETAGNRFVTTNYLSRRIANTTELTTGNKLVTPAWLNSNRYATQQYVLNNRVNFEVRDKSLLDLLVTGLSSNVGGTTPSTFVRNVAPLIAQDTESLPFNLANELTQGYRKEVFLDALSERLTKEKTTDLIEGMADRIRNDNNLQDILRGPSGSFTSPDVVRRVMEPQTMWCAGGQLCKIPSGTGGTDGTRGSLGIVLNPSQAIYGTAGSNIVNIRDNVQLPGYVQFVTQNDLEASDSTITTGRFGRSDAQIKMTNNTDQTFDTLRRAQNSQLEIYGMAKAFDQSGATGNVVPTRGSRRIKMYDDVVITNKLAVGQKTEIDQNSTLRIGGPSRFEGSVDITGKANINNEVNIRGSANITGNTSIIGNTSITGNTNIVGSTNITGGTTITGELRSGNFIGGNATLNSLNVPTSTIGNLHAGNMIIDTQAESSNTCKDGWKNIKDGPKNKLSLGVVGNKLMAYWKGTDGKIYANVLAGTEVEDFSGEGCPPEIQQ